MTSAEFRAALADAGLTQAGLARLLKGDDITISDRTVVSRWARGLRPVPDAVALCLKLWQMLPKTKRRKLLCDDT